MIQLFNEDCLENLKRMPDGYVDMVLCDLPYGTTRNRWDTVIPLDLLWEKYLRVVKSSGCIVLFAQSPFDKVLGSSRLDLLKYEWIWEKEAGTGFLNAKKAPLKSHENILVFYRNLPTYNPQFEKGTPYKQRKGGGTDNYNKDSVPEVVTENTGYRYPKTVLRFDRDRAKVHPTQKPVPLLEYLIKTYTNPGMVVLDNTMGSGSTGVACVNTGRSFVGIDKDPGYFKIAQERIKAAQDAKKASSVETLTGT
jgi:site-specific DNA-methyltransferase (adenine-specific)